MQSKISAFFKPSSSNSSTADKTPIPIDQHSSLEKPEITVTYKRRTPNPDREGNVNSGSSNESSRKVEAEKEPGGLSKCAKVLNKKRNYAQFHLSLGQSDFLFHTCKTCGFQYAAGDEGDEKVHKTFHKNYMHGVPFKGWRKERVIDTSTVDAGRVIMVLEDDPSAQKNKVLEVVRMMEMELGEGWIYDKHCTVYLFVTSQRIAGCLVVEPIKKAHRILPSSGDSVSDGAMTKAARSESRVLQFGGVSFQRERVRRKTTENSQELYGIQSGVILCEKEAIPARCGVRAIWVAPSNRRKHIASYLLDAVRKSFCSNLVLEREQLAFSQPTSVGRALISSYTSSNSFLVYITTDID